MKHMPIDRNSADLITPLLKFGSGGIMSGDDAYEASPQYKRMMNSGGSSQSNNTAMSTGSNGGATKRSVSETKKKFVASKQNWRCNACAKQLPAWFEVDHVVRLEHGGSNHVDNLVALCRDCHGQKTAMESMK